jgi:hypothetical protein
MPKSFEYQLGRRCQKIESIDPSLISQEQKVIAAMPYSTQYGYKR